MASRQAKQLARARHAARKRGLRADLYLDDWLQTIEDFEWKCAYCGKPYQTLDHFIALVQGGGTSIDNCVPSCLSCNQCKQGLPLKNVKNIPLEILERTRRYLAGRRSGQLKRQWGTMQVPPFPSRKGFFMNSDMMQCTPFQLANGKALYLYSGDNQLAFQMRELANADDPLSQGFQVATAITPMECIKLALTLLEKATPLLEHEQKPEKENAASVAFPDNYWNNY
ncbi:MAG TPA: HNH endonuclease signature motif containing protein [Ktedonobacteraceae bacterium]|nr:HNH endonuclease signature motif containing protein [Ktedonobacteraceae bacterium]